MRTPRILVNERFVRKLGLWTNITLIGVALVGIGWLGRLALLNHRISIVRTAVAKQQSTADQARQELAAATKNAKLVPSSGKHIVAELQSAMEAAAAQRGCVVTELSSTGESGPYISVYGGTAVAGWMQTPVRMTLLGSTPAIIDSLRSLENTDILFEIVAIDAQRSGVRTKGDATVTTTVDVRLIHTSEGA